MAANSKKTARGPGKPFEKGKSGNPNGRPKVDKDVKEMLKAAAPQAAALLIETVNNPEIKMDLRIRCAETLMDRVYGKAVQPIEGNMDNKVEIVMGGAAKYAD
jgi:hypothetical protein